MLNKIAQKCSIKLHKNAQYSCVFQKKYPSFGCTKAIKRTTNLQPFKAIFAQRLCEKTCENSYDKRVVTA